MVRRPLLTNHRKVQDKAQVVATNNHAALAACFCVSSIQGNTHTPLGELRVFKGLPPRLEPPGTLQTGKVVLRLERGYPHVNSRAEFANASAFSLISFRSPPLSGAP